MKIVRRGALPVGSESGLLDVRDRARARRRGASATRGDGHDRGHLGPVRRRGCSRSSTPDAIAPLRVVIDAANGMAGAMLPPVLERLPQVDAVRCYFEPDGSFPNHEPNPLLPENREFIVAQDDARRAPTSASPTTATPTAASSSTTRASSCPATSRPRSSPSRSSRKEPGGKVIYDVRASWAVPEAIRAAGGEPLVNRVGHAFIKQRMRDEGAVFGGEVSAHYYFRDFTQADSGVIPFLLMLELVSARGAEAERDPARRSASRYFLTGEINTPVADVAREAAGAEGALRPRGPRLAPRRPLDRRATTGT